MREIKFRAFDPSTQHMFQPQTLEELTTKTSYILVGWKNLEVMQFTGVLDLHGVEVYEGDIIKVLDRDWPSQLGDFPDLSHEEYIDSIASICQVVYEPAEFFLKQIRGKGHFSPSLSGVYGRDYFEVIGNIYENPELLEAKND